MGSGSRERAFTGNESDEARHPPPVFRVSIQSVAWVHLAGPAHEHAASGGWLHPELGGA